MTVLGRRPTDNELVDRFLLLSLNLGALLGRLAVDVEALLQLRESRRRRGQTAIGGVTLNFEGRVELRYVERR